jgi:hypothetical protein
MSDSCQTLERLCFDYTRRIAVAASDPELGKAFIEAEVNHAMTHLMIHPEGAPKVNLKLFSAQLEGAKSVLAMDEPGLRLIIRARVIVEERIQHMELEGL